MTAPRSSVYKGWWRDDENSTVDLYIGTGGASDPVEAARATATTFTWLGTSGMTINAGGLTVTAGGATITAGNLVAAAGDIRATAGNYRGGPVNAFATTEPTQAVVLEAGTAPSGAITTSSGIYATATVLNKIIADGTASAVG